MIQKKTEMISGNPYSIAGSGNYTDNNMTLYITATSVGVPHKTDYSYELNLTRK